MPRRLTLALGLLALVAGLCWCARPAAAQTADPGIHHPASDSPAEMAHDLHAQPNILEPQPSLAIYTVIVFLLLLAVLWKFAWGPLSQALHDREHHLEHTLAETERARDEAQRLLAEHRAQMAQAADQVRAILEEARRDAEATAADILRKAQAEAEASRQRAQRDIESARDSALVEIWNRTADLAVTVAGRALGRGLDEGEHRRLVELAINELPEAPARSNGHGGHA